MLMIIKVPEAEGRGITRHGNRHIDLLATSVVDKPGLHSPRLGTTRFADVSATAPVLGPMGQPIGCCTIFGRMCARARSYADPSKALAPAPLRNPHQASRLFPDRASESIRCVTR
jgi:hypothetical protein